jgi:hypothetical protein
MKGNTVYFILAAIAAVVIGAVWCFQSGPCSEGNSTPGDAPSGIGGAIKDAINSAAQFSTQSGSDLQNEDNGIIFGGGS